MAFRDDKILWLRPRLTDLLVLYEYKKSADFSADFFCLKCTRESQIIELR